MKKQILDELCATTGWHRDHARKALRTALVLKPVRPRAPRPALYGEPVIEALRFCWAVPGTPCGRLLAAVLPDLVPRLRRFKELEIDAGTATQLLKIAPATIDGRLKADRAKLEPRGRSHTKPGTLLKDSIPVRTWAEWKDAVPGFVEIDLVGHEGGNNQGEFCFTLALAYCRWAGRRLPTEEIDTLPSARPENTAEKPTSTWISFQTTKMAHFSTIADS